MLEFLGFAKAFLSLAALCLWLWGASGSVVVHRCYRQNPAPQNWQSYKSMFTDSSYPVRTEFRKTMLGLGGFLICCLLLCIVAHFDPA